ncbi:MAG TPA: LacI family DNA-binding transcriptional regulator [Gemmatimonadaceae bacterium]|nr:LacI family DNA-binding transcriptional regulator [Gemmatimonadaceae bacterium]
MVTIRDVAREANVSVATVSRVFNGGGPVREETRQRIHDIATALRYVPHGGARSLITSKTSTIGVLLPDLYGEFFSEVIRGIDLAARRSGYHLILSSSHSDRGQFEGAMRAMRGRVDGVIIMSPDIDAQALMANLPDSQPVVLLNCALRGAAFDCVNIDNTRGARAIVRHLVSHGHKRIALIAGAPRNVDGHERHLGYRAALRDALIDRNSRWETPGNFTEDSGFEAMRTLLKLRARPTAVFAANDSMAIGALSALRDAGVHVPDEVAVAGFDDIPIARHVNPPLTSVHVPIAELGERATEKLIGALGNKSRYVRRNDVLGTTLVIRSSCGPAGHA